jgi:hypothetical protein
VNDFRLKAIVLLPALSVAGLCLGPLGHCVTYEFQQTTLVPDLPTVAEFLDPQSLTFTSGAGVHSPIRPFSIADGRGDLAAFDDGTDVNLRLNFTDTPQGSIAGAFGAPKGISLDGMASEFALGENKASLPIFSTEEGSISGLTSDSAGALDFGSSGAASFTPVLALSGGLPYVRSGLPGASAPVAFSEGAADALPTGGGSPLDVRERNGDLYVASEKQPSSGEIFYEGQGYYDPNTPPAGSLGNAPGGSETNPIVISDPSNPASGTSGTGDSPSQTFSDGSPAGGGTSGGAGGGPSLIGSLGATVPDAAETALLFGFALAALAPVAWRRQTATAKR